MAAALHAYNNMHGYSIRHLQFIANYHVIAAWVAYYTCRSLGPAFEENTESQF